MAGHHHRHSPQHRDDNDVISTTHAYNSKQSDTLWADTIPKRKDRRSSDCSPLLSGAQSRDLQRAREAVLIWRNAHVQNVEPDPRIAS